MVHTKGWWMAWVPSTVFNQIAFSIIIYILAIIIVIFHEILQYKAFWWVVAIFSFALVMYLDNYIEKRVKDKREFKESSTMFYNDPHYKLKGWLISLFLALPYPLLFVIAIHWWD